MIPVHIHRHIVQSLEACSSLKETMLNKDQYNEGEKYGTDGANGPHIMLLQDFERRQTMLVYAMTEGQTAGANHWFDIQT